MNFILTTYDVNGAQKTAIATVPQHGHADATSGGQLNAGSAFSAGQIPLARGGTNADLSATGGTSQILKQSSAGAAVSVGVLTATELGITGQLDGTNKLTTVKTFNFKDFNVEDSGSNVLGIWHNLPGIVGGRLTLTSGTPVTTSNVTGAGTLYYTPYLHDKIALFDGTRWKVYTFAEISLALTLTSGKNYDVFLYDNAGTLTLELSNAWTNDTTRADALTTQNGVQVKSGATTRRYLGTIRASGTNTTEDSDSKGFVWNYYNSVLRTLHCVAPDNSWTYTTATWRSPNANTTTGQSRVEMVIGLSTQKVIAVDHTMVQPSAAIFLASGVGIDSTNTNSAQQYGTPMGSYGNVSARYAGYPGIGFHYLSRLEISQASGTTTWFGTGGTAYTVSGMTVEVWA